LRTIGHAFFFPEELVLGCLIGWPHPSLSSYPELHHECGEIFYSFYVSTPPDHSPFPTAALAFPSSLFSTDPFNFHSFEMPLLVKWFLLPGSAPGTSTMLGVRVFSRTLFHFCVKPSSCQLFSALFGLYNLCGSNATDWS